MEPSRRRQIELVYEAALRQDVAQRLAFVIEACGGDEELMRLVVSMLAERGTETRTSLIEPGAAEHDPATPGELAQQVQVGPYRLEALLGQGGMGQVFRATDTRLHRKVAIKALHGEGTADPVSRSRFLQEARAASALNHPNIVVIYDITRQQGVDYLVMEYVAGQTLKNLIRSEGLPFPTIVQAGLQIAAALVAAHAAGIVHRDIKPANVMVTPEGQAKILDFGVAKMAIPTDAAASSNAARPSSRITRPGQIVGTVSYMSPEQTRGEPVDGRSDVFSLGCVLYEAATGRLPFDGLSTLAILHEIATAKPLPPSRFRDEIPAVFDELTMACLEKDPALRPSASELVKMLGRLAGEMPRAPHRVETAARSVAVVPFHLRTSLPEDEFLAIALADAVIHWLSGTGKLVVRPIASVARFKGTDAAWPEVARQLNVDLIVEGTVQKAGNKVRVFGQVVRVHDGLTLHSFQQDGTLEDLFGLQDRVAESVAAALDPTEVRRSRPAIPPTKNPLAYELYMRAVDRLANWNRYDISAGIDMLNRVVELDPNLADAWGQLAQAYSQMGMFLDPDPKWFELAEAAITRTLDLDPAQSDALCARGFVMWSPSRGYQHRPALRAMNAALKISPARHNFRWFRGLILFHLGFYRDAERDAADSLVANPRYAVALVALGKIAEYRGDYGAANEFNERALSLDPALVLANVFAPYNLLAMDRIADAREKLQTARAMVPGESRLTALDGLIAALEGDFRQAERLADEASSQCRSVTHTHHTWHTAANVYALCGKPERAIAELRRCAEQGLPNYCLFGSDPFLKPLHSHSDFVSLQTQLRRDLDQFRKDFDLAEAG